MTEQPPQLQKEQTSNPTTIDKLLFRPYKDEDDILTIKALMDEDLSEPYTIFTYRYFIHNWPELAILVYDTNLPPDHPKACIGAIVSKCDEHKHSVTQEQTMRGYIGMLAVTKPYRKMGIGSMLVKKGITKILEKFPTTSEIVLETELNNEGALRLYERLGFVRVKRLHKYYLNGGDAVRLKIFLRNQSSDEEDVDDYEKKEADDLIKDNDEDFVQ